jgi:hypothetical protein
LGGGGVGNLHGGKSPIYMAVDPRGRSTSNYDYGGQTSQNNSGLRGNGAPLIGANGIINYPDSTRNDKTN